MIVYKITNLINGKTYIGQTVRSVEDRWKEHCKPCMKRRSYVANAIQKHGKDNFYVEELRKADSQSELDLLEKSYISSTDSLYPNGYNLAVGGKGGSPSDHVKKKISRSMKGKKLPDTVKKKLSESNKGQIPVKRRPVIGQHIETGEIIELEFMSQDPRFSSSPMARCCRGKLKTYKKYVWSYK